MATRRWTAVAMLKRSSNGHDGERTAHQRTTAVETKLQRRQRKCCWREKRRERAGREKTATEEKDEEIRREKMLLE